MKIGDKAKGFKHEGLLAGISCSLKKKEYDGKVGVVTYVCSDYFRIQFDDDWWLYPLELAHLSKIEWTPQRGEMIEVSDGNDIWHTAEFIAHVECIVHPYVVLFVSDKCVLSFKFARQINPVIAEIAQLEDQIKKLKEKL